MQDVVIVEAVRTAVGRYLGALKEVEAYDLAALILEAKDASIREGLLFRLCHDNFEPAAPARQDQPNRLDNVEQVLVDQPVAGTWQIRIHGHSVQEQQAYTLISTSNVTVINAANATVTREAPASANAGGSGGGGNVDLVLLLLAACNLFLAPRSKLA